MKKRGRCWVSRTQQSTHIPPRGIGVRMSLNGKRIEKSRVLRIAFVDAYSLIFFLLFFFFFPVSLCESVFFSSSFPSSSHSFKPALVWRHDNYNQCHFASGCKRYAWRKLIETLCMISVQSPVREKETTTRGKIKWQETLRSDYY